MQVLINVTFFCFLFHTMGLIENRESYEINSVVLPIYIVAKDVIKVVSNHYSRVFGYDSCILSRPFFCYITKL